MTSTVDLSLVVPCLNEEGNVLELADRFFASAQSEEIEAEIVFIDDGSTDETHMRIEQAEVRYPDQIVSIRHEKNRGIPQAWKTGVREARGEVVCLIDGDLQNRPEDAVRLFKVLTCSQADLVRGIRIAETKVPRSRVLMSRFLNQLLNLLFGMNSADNKSGFVAARRDILLRLTSPQGRYHHYQTFIGVAANHLNLRVIEVKTSFEDRRSGVSFLTGSSLNVIRQVFVDIFEARREFSSSRRRVPSS